MLTEITTPFDNLYWKLSKCGLEGTPFGYLVGIVFSLSWLVFRVLLFPFILWMIFLHRTDLLQMTLYMKIVLASNVGFLGAINYIWFVIGPFKELVFGKAASNKTKKAA
jgi:hypothetical protein